MRTLYFGVFRTRSFSDWFFFDFRSFSSLSREGGFFFWESMGLFCLLGSRLVKSVKNFSFFWDVLCTSSLICNPTFSISFQVPSLRPYLCNPLAPTHHHHHHRLTKILTQALMTSCCQYRDSNMLVLERGWCVHILRFWNIVQSWEMGRGREGEDERGEGREMEGEKVEGGWEDGESEGDRVRVKRWLWYNDKQIYNTLLTAQPFRHWKSPGISESRFAKRGVFESLKKLVVEILKVLQWWCYGLLKGSIRKILPSHRENKFIQPVCYHFTHTKKKVFPTLLNHFFPS